MIYYSRQLSFSALVSTTKFGVCFWLPQSILRVDIISSSSVEFNVEKVQDVEWNEDAFDNLVLAHGHKYLLQSLVEAHHNETGFDDFIKGKGQGLVVNLFGPPGVGEAAFTCFFQGSSQSLLFFCH